jgi:ABC-type lipoprotein export system ATPase subunit
MDEEPELKDKEDAIHLEEAQGVVDMEHVKFGYVEGKTIIHDLNLHADKGSLVAIVGPTGAGKTTLINLLMRFYDPQSGAVKLDHHDLRDLTRKSVRSQYAMVLQDTWLFEGTIFENISYGKPDATMEEVIQAAKAARIHNTIMRFPNGYDTHLNENGLNISQGQKQMLTIAKEKLKNAGFRPYYLYRLKNMAGSFENVGYCKEGTPCIYNIRIMEERQIIIALGAGGISKMYYPEENRLERVPNVSNYEIYISRLEEMLERKEKNIFMEVN